MLYKGKEYDENGILELLNNKDKDILTYKEKLDGAETKIKSFEEAAKMVRDAKAKYL